MRTLVLLSGFAAAAAFTPSRGRPMTAHRTVPARPLLSRPTVLRAAGDDGSSKLQDAVKAFASGQLSKEDFEKMVRKEEAATAAREAAEAQAKAAALAAEKAKFVSLAAGGFASVGLVVGGLADGALANGDAP